MCTFVINSYQETAACYKPSAAVPVAAAANNFRISHKSKTKDQFLPVIFSRKHATLQPALSVG